LLPIEENRMSELWKKIRKALEPPTHPIQFNKTQPMDHLVNELVDAKKAWDGEQTITNATRYITLLELVQRHFIAEQMERVDWSGR
tara:strand:+ start:1060 stop:1317 length:258 start_codon:yes stop_codon:yes gene_type:complete